MSRWPTMPLGDITNVEWGNTTLTKASYVSEGFPAFSATGGDGFMPSYEHEHDGIVLSAIGANCGKCFLAKGRWTAIKNTITITNSPNGLCTIPYLFYFLNNQNLWPKRGGGQPFISQGDARKVIVPVPPIPEQNRLVKLLDEADELRKLRAQADERTDALIPALFNEMFGDPKTNIKKWPLSRLGQYVAVQGGHAFKSKDYIKNGVRLVKIANVHYQNLSWDEQECLPNSYLDTYPTFTLRKGDILVALTRPIIKSLNSVKVARVADADLPSLLNQRVGRLVIKRQSAVDAMYLLSFCYTNFFKEQINLFCSVALQPNVSTDQVESIPFLLPPPALQKEFAKCADEINILSAIQSASRQHLDDLFQSMLHRAFSGEL